MVRLRGRRGHGLDLEDGLEQVLDDLGLALLAGLLDLLDPGVGLPVGLVLGLLVALVVLYGWRGKSFRLASVRLELLAVKNRWGVGCFYLGLEFLELLFLGLAVVVDLLLGLVTGLAYPLGPDYEVEQVRTSCSFLEDVGPALLTGGVCWCG